MQRSQCFSSRLALLFLLGLSFYVAESYRIGSGIADVTGPTTEVPFMGYAMENQKGKGLHLRQKARAFVVAEDDLSSLFAYVSADLCMSFQGVRDQVIKMLGQKFGSVYNESNVLISGTHTHGGPGGFSSNTLYAITILGFQQENFDAICAGIFSAIATAHQNMLASAPGAEMLVNVGTLLDSNINRSPTSYLQNPAPERDFYGSDTDKNMTVVRMLDAAGKDIGMINWFAVHGTSMNNTNYLVSSDNKGYASYLFEKFMNPPGTPSVSGPYVAAFAQTNSGDVSPRTRGAFCPDGVTPCERYHSTCGGKEEGCNGIGPGKDDFESTQIIGAHQVVAAAEIGGFNMSSLHDFLTARLRTSDIYPRAMPSVAHRAQREPMDSWSDIFPGRRLGDSRQRIPRRIAKQLDFGPALGSPRFRHSKFAPSMVKLEGPVDFRLSYVDMHNLVVTPEWTGLQSNVTLCHAAMGDAFAAGTTDGNGELNFTQGDNSSTSNPFWNALAHVLSNPTKEEIACQAPKPILFNTGDITWPTPWTQAQQPVQILRIGNLFILGSPAEITTMAGRRLRASTAQVLRDHGVADPIVVINEISNAYCGYTATFEEFQAQRYEAASTIFGPHELAAWQQEFARLAIALATGQPVDPGPHPPDLSGKMPNFLAGVVFDSTPLGKAFGDPETEPLPSYSITANSTASATFWGASPRNEFEQVPSFFNVEMLLDGKWMTVASDADWETKFHWERSGLANSLVTTEWDVPANATPGTYRFHVFGRSKSLLGKFSAYEGYSRSFELTP